MNDMTNILAHAYRCPSAISPALEAMMGLDMARRFGKYRIKAESPRPEVREAVAEKKAARREENRQAIIQALTKPLTIGDLRIVLGWSDHHIGTLLSGMLDEGLVSVETVCRVRIWSRADTVGVSRVGEV